MSKPLSELTRKQKLALLDALEEKKRRQRDARDSYAPNKGQLEVHSSKAIERYCFAGNGSGKTTLLVNEVLWAAAGYNPITKQHSKVPARIIVVLDSPSKVDDVFLREMRKWYSLKPEQLHKRGKPYCSQITFENGSTIDFFFHLQEEMAAESFEWDHAFFDEPCGRKLYIAIKRGGRTKSGIGRVLLIGTPIAASWLRKQVYEPWARGESPNTECFRFGTSVNEKNLAEGYIDEFSRVLSDKERRIRMEGEFFDLEGLALAHLFDRESHLLPDDYYWNPSHPVVIAIDPHPRKAHTALMLGVTPDNYLFALKEYSSRSIPSQFARELREWTKGYKVVDVVCDSLGSTPMSGGFGNRSFIEVLNDTGFRARATTFADKQDESWIAKIQEVLAVPLEPDNFGKTYPRLRIHKACKGLVADIETVEWAKYRQIEEYKPKLAIESKDFLSCLKYALAAEPKYTKGREQVIRPKGAVSWNKKELWRSRT